MTTLADQLAQALALVSTGALDEDYSKIAAAAAVAEQPSETPSPSSLRRAEHVARALLEAVPSSPLPAGRPLAAFAPDGAMCELRAPCTVTL